MVVKESRQLEHSAVKLNRDTYALREPHTRFPSPLVGEGGSLRTRASNEPGEGCGTYWWRCYPSPGSAACAASPPSPARGEGRGICRTSAQFHRNVRKF